MFKTKKVAHIVAMGVNGEIGGNNELLWHIPEDLRFFKDMTIGRAVLMGRKTVESLPKPLERRITLTVTRKPFKNDCFGFGRNFERDLESYMQEAEHCCDELLNSDTIFIAGGVSLYNATFDIVDELYVTHVEHEFPAADTFYAIPEGFVKVGDIVPSTLSCDGLRYHISKYERCNV